AGAAKQNFLARLGTPLNNWTEVVGGQVLSKQGEKWRTGIRFIRHPPHTPWNDFTLSSFGWGHRNGRPCRRSPPAEGCAGRTVRRGDRRMLAALSGETKSSVRTPAPPRGCSSSGNRFPPLRRPAILIGWRAGGI